MGDFESIREVGRSWWPPRVECEFTYLGDTSIEYQADWAYFLPAALFLGAAASAWYAWTHPSPNSIGASRPRWHRVAGVVVYSALVVLTPVGLLAMAWRDDGWIARLPLLTIPLLPAWTLHWIQGWSDRRPPRPPDVENQRVVGQRRLLRSR
jgi:hypothetical protein